ncbi:rod shape-determining protein MreC [bacterium]|nr:rod shape-determining protein MreC [bacterium]
MALLIGGVKAISYATGRTNPIDSAISAIFSPLVVAVRYVGEGIGSLGHLFRLPSLLRENRKLEGQVELLSTQIGQTESLKAENEQLRRLLQITQGNPRALPARVVARPYDLWLESVIVSVGKSRGVRRGDLVVNERGVVGVVSEKVDAGLSSVTLISSPAFRLAAITGSSNCEGIVAGEGIVDGKASGELRLMYVTAGSPVQVNEKVYTSGVTGSPESRTPRPRGILIGTVKHVAEDVNGFLTIELTPAVDTNAISNLLVYTQ